MTTTSFLKGLVMTLVAVAVTALSTVPVVWSVVAITLIGTALLYIGKNAFTALQSTAPPNTLSFQNIISGLLIAIGSAFVEGVATLAGTGVIQWELVWKVALSVTFTYLASTLFAGPTKK